MKYIWVYIFLLSCNISPQVNALADIKTRDVVTGLDTPWEILWGPDGYIWMTERFGRVSRVNPETSELIEILRISEVLEDGERGLMGMVLHPRFYSSVPEMPANPYVYLIYNYGTKDNTKVKLVRYTYSNNKLESPVELIKDIPGAWNHDGSRMWIDPDDWTLYFTMGDAAVQDRAQSLSSLNGKILRMNLDGTIPSDNPFPNSFVWSWGHRNPQGFVVANGKIYSSEHGTDTDDELNIINKGRNYGWPNVRGYCNLPAEQTFCDANNVVEPIAAWTPTIAVAGIDYYYHNLISEWNNSILLVALKGSMLVQLKLDENGNGVVSQTNYFSGQFGRLRDICISPEGKVYVSTSNKDGRGNPAAVDDRIIEITPITLKKNDEKDEIVEFDFYPNPFSETINFNLNNYSQDCLIFIHDIFGNIVKELYAGNGRKIIWDGKDDNGNVVNNGFYFIRVKSSVGSYFTKVIKSAW